MTKISFILRTYNEEAFIGLLFDTLLSQTNREQYAYEFIVVDSSSDTTPDIAERYGARVLTIPKAEFNWSYALNLGIENSTGELLIIMSAHAIPAHKDWLSIMLSRFNDATVAGVYCRQVPWPDAPWSEVYRLNATFKDRSVDYSKESTELPAFSNACSCIRRSVWNDHKFVILPSSEDREWAKWALDNGYRIFYEAAASVYHSHYEEPRIKADKVIEIELNRDINFNRKRTVYYTYWQAAKWFIRDSRKLLKLKPGRKELISNLLECAQSSFWFVADFKRVQNDLIRKRVID